MLLRLLAPFLANVLGLYIAIRYVPGVYFSGPMWMLFAAGAFLSLLHFFVKPIFKLLAFPLVFLTAGLFSLVINAGLLWFADKMFEELVIDGVWPLGLTTLILSIVHFIL